MELAQIKKIDFKFSNLMHSALVSISGTSDDMFIHIQLINSFLRKIFGVEHIRFLNQKGEIKLQDEKHPFVYQIAQLIINKLGEEFQGASTGALRAV
jgi:hypothetical protein